MNSAYILIQAIPSTTSQQGVETTIVIRRPDEEYEGVEPNYLIPNTAYITGVEKNKPLPKFSHSFCTALAMPIHVYLSILLFLQTTWPDIEKEMKIQLIDLYRKTKQIKTGTRNEIQTKVRESVVYERWFDDVYFHAVRNTQAPYEQIHIQRMNTHIKFDVSILKKLSSARENLISLLLESGHDFI